MVKIGFICEGECEKIILESETFQEMLNNFQMKCIYPVIDAGGNGNLLPGNIEIYLNRLSQAGAEKVFILTDFDLDRCISLTKERIVGLPVLNPTMSVKVVIAVKQLESWFLADTEALSSLLKTKHVEEYPESKDVPVDTLNQLSIKYLERGLGNVKPKIARKMIALGFSIARAATHPNCPSAKYFIDKLKETSVLGK